MRTVIVDDEQYAIDRLSRLLESIEIIEIVNTFTNSKEFLKNFQKEKPDLIFTDVEMPEMSGIELVKQIKKDGYNPNVIFVTAFDHYAIKAIKEQAFDYLLKPVDVDELKNTISRLANTNDISQNKFDSFYIKYNLTKREQEIIQLLLQGCTSSDIGNELFISKHTVDTHRRNILEKTGFSSSNELIINLAV